MSTTTKITTLIASRDALTISVVSFVSRDSCLHTSSSFFLPLEFRLENLSDVVKRQKDLIIESAVTSLSFL